MPLTRVPEIRATLKHWPFFRFLKKKRLAQLLSLSVSYQLCPFKVKVFCNVRSKHSDKNKIVFPQSFIEFIGIVIIGLKPVFSMCTKPVQHKEIPTVINFEG